MSDRKGLSADCTLDPLIVLAVMMDGKEHPCDRCNTDRKKCRGYSRIDKKEKDEEREERKEKESG